MIRPKGKAQQIAKNVLANKGIKVPSSSPKGEDHSKKPLWPYVKP